MHPRFLIGYCVSRQSRCCTWSHITTQCMYSTVQWRKAINQLDGQEQLNVYVTLSSSETVLEETTETSRLKSATIIRLIAIHAVFFNRDHITELHFYIQTVLCFKQNYYQTKVLYLRLMLNCRVPVTCTVKSFSSPGSCWQEYWISNLHQRQLQTSSAPITWAAVVQEVLQRGRRLLCRNLDKDDMQHFHQETLDKRLR